MKFSKIAVPSLFQVVSPVSPHEILFNQYNTLVIAASPTCQENKQASDLRDARP